MARRMCAFACSVMAETRGLDRLPRCRAAEPRRGMCGGIVPSAAGDFVPQVGRIVALGGEERQAFDFGSEGCHFFVCFFGAKALSGSIAARRMASRLPRSFVSNSGTSYFHSSFIKTPRNLIYTVAPTGHLHPVQTVAPLVPRNLLRSKLAGVFAHPALS